MRVEIPDELIQFSHTVKVLFVEDSICSANNSHEMLKIFFSHIDVVSDFQEAYEHFESKKYDLIITGLNMPHMDGMTLITRIRKISKDITILLISSNTNRENFSELIKLGIDGFIIRPVYVKQFSEVMHKTIEKLKNKQELYEYRVNLEQKVQEQVAILREKDKVLAQQSKLAAMGEMMDAVAHQWKQPLNIINMKADMLRYDCADGYVDQEYCNNLYEKIISQTSHMTDTLDEFRGFLRPDKEQDIFSISSIIDNVVLLVNDELVKYQITIEKNIQYDVKIQGIKNEFKHLILNLISNSKDAFNENNIENRTIQFNIFKDDKLILEVIDNAGGIPSKSIDKIFDANFTLKPKGKGTGIGLYMSKQIVNKHHGEIFVENTHDGAKFTIEF
jgi:signal transduction histidine kinase